MYEAYIPTEEDTRSFDELRAINPEVMGWLRVNDTSINYPLLQGEDNSKYVNTDVEGNYSLSGAIFLHCMNAPDFTDFNSIIYGHHMDAGTMFALLPSYARQDFWEEHPVIRFDTLYERGEYEVMAAFYSQVYDADAQGVFRYYQYTDLSSPERFQEYVEQVKAAALYDTGVTAEYGDQLLTLSTCNYHTGDGRFVVVARKQAREGEVH